MSSRVSFLMRGIVSMCMSSHAKQAKQGSHHQQVLWGNSTTEKNMQARQRVCGSGSSATPWHGGG